MKRLVFFCSALPLLVLLGAGVVFSASSPDKDSPPAIRERIQKALDAVAAKPSPVVLVIPIREEIALSTAVYVEREMKRVAQEHVDLVVVDINTPGGRGDAMMRICNALIQQRSARDAAKVPTVAFIDSDAYSAGAFISMACNRIYIAPNGKIGAATGYVPGWDGLPVKLPEDVEEKLRSATSEEVRALAKVNGYPPGIADAMVDRDQGLTEMEIDGKRELLTDKEWNNRKRELGLNDLPPREYAKRVKKIKTICPKGEILVLDHEEAKSVGLATDIVGSREAVFAALGLKNPSVIEARHNSSEEADRNSPEAIRAQIQKDLEAVAAKPSPLVLVIPIREQIELSTAVYVEREMRRGAAEHMDLVLVDINTPGGRGDAMMRICNALIQQRSARDAAKVPTVAFIDSDAYSAGAFISMACNRIYIAPNGKIGAATGYVPGPDGIPVKLPEAVEEKFSSAMRGEVRALAKVNGYSASIAEAMVDRDQGVTEVEIDGKREYLTDKEFANRRRELGLDELSPRDLAKRVKELRVVCQKGELLTLDYEQAKSVGLATDILDSREAVFAALGLKKPAILMASHNWSEQVFGYLTSDAVKGILLLLGLMGLYMEFKATGLVLPGILGAICLALFFFSQYFMGLADYTGALLFVVGAVLVLFEIFVVPGFGIPGVVGILLMIAGVFLGMQHWVLPPDIHNPIDMDIFKTNLMVVCAVLFAMVAFAVLLAKVLPSTPFLSRIILTSRGPAGELRASGTAEEVERTLEGVTGKATSRLRPAGRAEINGKVLDVVTDGQFIEEGTSIRVARVEGNRVIVRKAE